MTKVFKEPIRILQIGMHNQIGGVETYLYNYYKNINKNKIQFDFINSYDSLCFEDDLKDMGANIYKVPNFKKNPIGFYRSIKKIIQHNNYQIVHINMLSAANILPVLAAKKSKAKHIIVHSHNNDTPTGFLRKALDKINKKVLLKNATDFFACSDLAGQWMFGNHKFTIIENAIDLTKFKPNKDIRKRIRKELKVEDKFVIGHIGRFSYQKNHEFLIDVFNEVQKKIKNAVLLLIGTGELEQKIKNKVNDLKLNDKVIFFGTTDKVNEYFNAMDLFVLPSRFEGFGIVAIEAQATKIKTILSTNVPASVNVSNLAEFLPISDYKIWSNHIKKYFKNSNKISEEQDFPKEYNIKYAAGLLEKKYTEMN